MSVAVEDYAKAIYKLQSESAVATVSTNDLARHLGVTAASASEMLRKLDDLGLVTYVRYRGVRLTEAGRRSALAVVRRHRLLELYLAVALGLSWDQVHDEAERLEHALSPELEAVFAAGESRRNPVKRQMTITDASPIAASGRSEQRDRSLSGSPGEAIAPSAVMEAGPGDFRQRTRLGIALGSRGGGAGRA